MKYRRSMYMSSWVRIDYDFGLPYATFSIPQRSLAGTMTAEAARDPDSLEKFLVALVERKRPDLKGAQVVSISPRGGLWLEVAVIHPSLPIVMAGAGPERFSLESCRSCGKPLPDNAPIWTGMVDDDPNSKGPYLVYYCDGECYKKGASPSTRFIDAGHLERV